MGGQGGDLISGIFEVALECPEDLSLSVLAQRPHKELCLRKLARPVEKEKGCQSVRCGTLKHSVKSETPKWSVQSRGTFRVGSETPKPRVGKLG